MKTTKKILAFVDGMHPSEEQLKIARDLGASIRNSRYVDSDTPAETCDAVIGDVIPKQYKNKDLNIEILKDKWPKTPAPKKKAKAKEENPLN